MSVKKHETLVKEAKAGLKKVNLEISIINKTYNKLIAKAKKRGTELAVFGGSNEGVISSFKEERKGALGDLKPIKEAGQATLDCLTDDPLNRKGGTNG